MKEKYFSDIFLVSVIRLGEDFTWVGAGERAMKRFVHEQSFLFLSGILKQHAFSFCFSCF